ncbi:MAG: (2Fe-2S)-binding protein [Phycisphaeraceae bacterium]|nr:(2Fe-2S)-binding protein [Phycisphaeraceae bacterium]
MPTITINGRECEFQPGQMLLQVANAAGIEIPQYCYHDGLSIVASCRICLAEVWQPNPRNNNALEPLPKLVPTCQTACAPGMVVYTDSPKSIANQKAVMEYLLINHPLDCPVCDQSGECFLQDYSYEYGRGVSRFEETKVKQPKKNLGPHVYLYSDRCIMCTRCVRFTREVTGTAELTVTGRGNKEEIDVFPGIPLDNELSANVVDLCPVGALLEKDFLFAQRVWFLKSTPSIDGITASGDNIRVDHNDGKVYRIKPRTNMDVNKWWISDEIRYGWKHVHSENRLTTPLRRQFGVQMESDWNRAYDDALEGIAKVTAAAGRLGVMVSPMLSCEDAYQLARLALALDPRAVLAVGPVPRHGEDKTFPGGYTVYAEKCPNARGVKRVLDAVAKQAGVQVLDFAGFVGQLKSGAVRAAVITGNYPSDWATDELLGSLKDRYVVVIDTHGGALTERADVVLASATWVEKAGTFENAKGLLQAFEQAIPTAELSKSEAQIALDLLAMHAGSRGVVGTSEMVIDPAKAGQVPDSSGVSQPLGAAYNAAQTRAEMARAFPALGAFASEVRMPTVESMQEPDMQVVEV